MNLVYYISIFFVLLFLLPGLLLYFRTVKMRVKTNEDLQRIIKTNDKMSILSETIKWFNGIKKESVLIQSRYGYSLSGYHIPAKESSKITVILSHGITAYKLFSTSYAQMFYNLGFNTFIYDHRNHGDSGGRNITYGYFERYDMESVVEYLKKRNGQESILGIHGVSMGAAITLLYAGSVNDNCSFYIADCPYSSMKKEVNYRIKKNLNLPSFMNNLIFFSGKILIRVLAGFNVNDVEPIMYIKNISSPLMVINTNEDDYIPMEMSKKIYAEKTGPKKLYWVPYGKHAMAYYIDTNEYMKQIQDFLRENKII